MNGNAIKKKVFYGGPIITMNDERPLIEAVGVEGEKIVAVGDLESVKEIISDNFELLDLKGKSLLPGFIDSHLHPMLFLFFLINPDLSKIKSLKELKEVLRKIAKNKKPGDFIVGLSLKEENFEKPVLPTRWDLDEACPDHPVFVLRYDGHIMIVNSKGLKFAGINSDTEVPGGEIRRNEKGELTGIISEQAMGLVTTKYRPNLEDFINIAPKAFKIFAEKGITSLHGIMQLEAGGELGDIGAIEYPTFKNVQDKILQNFYSLFFTENPKKLKRVKKPPIDGGKEDSKFKVGGLKLFLDGTFGAATGCMHEPFSDQPDKCGFCVVDLKELYEQMKIAHNLGFQIGVHAIGDKGNELIVDLYKRLLKEFPRDDHRHRIEHASMLTVDVIQDMKELGIIASCQPPFINSEYTWLEKRLGKERCKYTYPMKSLVDAGVVIASGSDCPIEDPSVILGLHALVTRNGFVPEQCISIEDALKTYTINAAYAAFEEKIKGSIEVGKLADFVILNKNPLEVSKDEIKDIQVMETIIRGKSVFKKQES